jgi:hypothetical protein
MGRWVPLFAGLIGFGALGCVHSPIDLSQGPAPLRMPRPGPGAESFEDSLTGGEVFAMYCNQCHNARALAERPFANYQNVAAHMRVRANFTGEEYEKLLEFLRRWHDIPQSTPPVEPSPKRLIFSQPVAELRDEIAPQAQPAAGAQPQPVPVPAPAGVQPQPAAGALPQPAAGALPPPVPFEPLPQPGRPPAGP